MKRYHIYGAACCAALALASVTIGAAAGQSAPAPNAPQIEQQREIILRNVTVVDTVTGRLSRARDIVVRGSRIEAIRAARKSYPASARTVDGTGKFVVPGYNDMHVHSLTVAFPGRDDELRLLLANGITGFRQMSGTPALLKERREGKLTLFPHAPTALSMPGQVLMPLNAANPAMATAEVRAQKADGVDFIKLVEADPATFSAAAAEAKRQGLTIVGHLPDRIDVRTAAAAGFHSIEHMGPWATILTSCSTDEAGLRQAIAARPARQFGGSGNGEALPAAMLEKIITTAAAAPALTSMRTNPGFLPMLRRVIDTYDASKCAKVVADIKRSGAWMSPTLIRVKTSIFPDNPQFVQDPNLRYVAPAARALWLDLGKQFGAQATATDRATLRDFWKLQLEVLKLFDQGGVPMLAGSDTPGQWNVAGFSLHADFDLLAEAGVKPLKILQMTTLMPARFLGRTATMGTVAAGRNADLVLLDADPVANAANLHRIRGVFREGQYYSREALDEMLAGVASRRATPGSN